MFYTRCGYVGQNTKDQKRMHGRGIFTFSNGNKYVGTFHDGMFHGQGIIFFTEANGGGQYRGVWNLGQAVSGDYIFNDGLKFDTEGWGHCTADNRKLWDETLTFIQPTIAAGGVPGQTTITPDYSTSDGIPPAFALGKPRSVNDVHDIFWSAADPPKPEHEAVADPALVEDMATVIAGAKP
jgi:hypothetical protein